MQRGTENAPQLFGADAVDRPDAEQSEQITEGRESSVAPKALLTILIALSCSHLLNDTIQALIPSIYPLLKKSFGLNFTQVGLITLTFQITGSIFQPVVGLYTDRRPKPYSLALGMTLTLFGLIILSLATNYPAVIAAAGMVGLGSAIFHPEASRIARLASGGRHGFAQSLFQVGGNAGSALGPLMAALIVVPYGQHEILWFSFAALGGITILAYVGSWYRKRIEHGRKTPVLHTSPLQILPRRTVGFSLLILLSLVFSKNFYLVSMTSYYIFYLIGKFHLSVQQSQMMLFLFLGSVALGTIIGGPMGDRYGRKKVIWISILGTSPFALALPYANLQTTLILSVIIGLIISSAFSAIVVYATELVPGRVGLISGLFFGSAFGMAGIGAVLLGKLADMTSIDFVYHVCSFLPLIGLLTGLLPNLERRK